MTGRQKTTNEIRNSQNHPWPSRTYQAAILTCPYQALIIHSFIHSFIHWALLAVAGKMTSLILGMYTRPLIWGLKVLLAVRTIMFVMNTSNQIVGGPDDILVYYQGETSVPSFPHHQTESQSTMLSSHCQYRDFPQETHPGLPHLFDVFADHTKEHAIFLGAHRKETIPGGPYDESDSLFTSDPKGNRMYHFLCRFQGAINVLSEAVHSPGIGGGHPFSKKRNFIIRCRIPPELRNLVVQGQRETMLHVDLVALDDPTANYTQIEVSQLLSSSSSDLPAVSQIPVCFPTSNSDRPSTPPQLPSNQNRSSWLDLLRFEVSI
jgi:hypothetical protein